MKDMRSQRNDWAFRYFEGSSLILIVGRGSDVVESGTLEPEFKLVFVVVTGFGLASDPRS